MLMLRVIRFGLSALDDVRNYGKQFIADVFHMKLFGSSKDVYLYICAVPFQFVTATVYFRQVKTILVDKLVQNPISKVVFAFDFAPCE